MYLVDRVTRSVLAGFSRMVTFSRNSTHRLPAGGRFVMRSHGLMGGAMFREPRSFAVQQPEYGFLDKAAGARQRGLQRGA